MFSIRSRSFLANSALNFSASEPCKWDIQKLNKYSTPSEFPENKVKWPKNAPKFIFKKLDKSGCSHLTLENYEASNFETFCGYEIFIIHF